MFETHRLNDRGMAEVHMFKQTMTDAIERILPNMPDGRLKSIFVTKMEEGVFFGTKAIAAKEGNFTHITDYSSKGAEVTNANQ
jgi:hypothetical protein